MPNRKTSDRRRRMGSKHLVLIAVLALLGAGGTFALVTDSAFANLATTAQQQGGGNNRNGQNNQNGQNGQNGDGNNNQDGQDGQNDQQNGQQDGQQNGQDGQAAAGALTQDDFVDITQVGANVQGKPQ